MSDAIFSKIVELQGGNFGNVLDAGTGRASLEWLCTINSNSWSAVTFEEGRRQILARDFQQKIRPCDRLLRLNWCDSDQVDRILANTQFEVVLADYFFGSVDRYVPHSLNRCMAQLCARLAPGGHLFVVGQEPDHSSDSLFTQLERLRDATQILCQRRPHREVPAAEVIEGLESFGLQMLRHHRFENHYGIEYFQRELGVLRQLVNQKIESLRLRGALSEEITALQEKAESKLANGASLAHSHDYLLMLQDVEPLTAGYVPNIAPT